MQVDGRLNYKKGMWLAVLGLGIRVELVGLFDCDVTVKGRCVMWVWSVVITLNPNTTKPKQASLPKQTYNRS